MSKGTYWSVEQCRWEPCGPEPELHWSVQRCRWEPVGPAADALATPWSVFAAAPPESPVPQQRRPEPAPVEA